jgi:NAD-dependent oxidoreductase involved in siderophore biosynthesis
MINLRVHALVRSRAALAPACDVGIAVQHHLVGLHAPLSSRSRKLAEQVGLHLWCIMMPVAF